MFMEVFLNGESRVVSSESVADLLLELGLEGRKVAVEHNSEVLKRDSYASIKLAAGDRLEIIHFVGGG